MANPYQGDDIDPFSGARDEETGDVKQVGLPASAKASSFGDAFKSARGRGDKTFEYMGKKYTTEMAGGKKAPAAASTPAPARSRMTGGKSGDADRDIGSSVRSTSSPTTRQGKRIAEIKEALSNPAGDEVTKPRVIGSYGDAARSQKTLGDMFRGNSRHARTGATYKKGGSVGSASKRADGCAQRGKTKGRMV